MGVVRERPAEVVLRDDDAERAVVLVAVVGSLGRAVAVARDEVQFADGAGAVVAAVGQRRAAGDVTHRRRELGRPGAGAAGVAVDRRGRDAGEHALVVERDRADPRAAAGQVLVSRAERVLERRRARGQVRADEAVVAQHQPELVDVVDEHGVRRRVGRRGERLPRRERLHAAGPQVVLRGGRRGREERGGERRREDGTEDHGRLLYRITCPRPRSATYATESSTPTDRGSSNGSPSELGSRLTIRSYSPAGV